MMVVAVEMVVAVGMMMLRTGIDDHGDDDSYELLLAETYFTIRYFISLYKINIFSG